MAVTSDSPYQFYLKAKDNFVAKFGTSLPWYFGKSYLSQNTAVERCVVVPDEEVDISHGGYNGPFNQGGPESFDIFQAGFCVVFHIFGTLERLFSTPNTQTAGGLLQKVGTVIQDSFKGPKNPEWQQGRFHQVDANDSLTSIWCLELRINVWVPVKYVQPSISQAPLETVVIEGELTNAS